MKARIKVRLAGVTFKNEDGTRRQDLLGIIYDDYWTEDREDEIVVELRREPDNAYDPNAIAVHATEPEPARGQLGYVEAEEAARISVVMDAGHAAHVSVITVQLTLSLDAGQHEAPSRHPH